MCPCWASPSGAAKSARRRELEQKLARSLEAELQRVPGTRDIRTLGGPGNGSRWPWILPVFVNGTSTLASLQATLAITQSVSRSGRWVIAARSRRPGPAADDHRGNRRVPAQRAEQLGQVVVGQHGGRPVFPQRSGPGHGRAAAGAAGRLHTRCRRARAGWRLGAPGRQVFPAVTLSVAKKAGENASTWPRRPASASSSCAASSSPKALR